MLVVISDLHLTDGSSGTTIGVDAFRTFRQRIRDLAYDASWRHDGRKADGSPKVTYRPIADLDIVLLGDVLDIIRSTRWLASDQKGVRPWDNWRKPPMASAFAAKVGEINDAILAHNAESLSTLKSLTDGKIITLPPATSDGRPAQVGWEPNAAKRLPVKVCLHYMVGNHDWFYHLPGKKYDAMRRSVADAMGLTTPADTPFPHEPGESDLLTELLDKHQVYARHGDIYDSMNFESERDASSLGDVIVIELLNRFAEEIRRNFKDLPRECLDGLREIDNVRPLLIVALWVDGLLERTCSDPAQIKAIKRVWDSLVDQFVKIPFVKERDSWLNPMDNVDKLQIALKFSKGVSLRTASRLLGFISENTVSRADDYFKYALAETAFKSRKAHAIVYGHTHDHVVVPLDVSYGMTGERAQSYLNSGTWRRVYRMARLNLRSEEFIGQDVMTYLAFYKDGEAQGRPHEAWSGALGALPHQI